MPASSAHAHFSGYAEEHLGWFDRLLSPIGPLPCAMEEVVIMSSQKPMESLDWAERRAAVPGPSAALRHSRGKKETEQEVDKIVVRFVRYIEKCGGDPDEWYVGLTDDAQKALFVDHGVLEGLDAWFYARAVSSVAALSLRAQIMASVGIEGTGDEVNPPPSSTPSLLSTLSDIVYVYKKAPHTRP